MEEWTEQLFEPGGNDKTLLRQHFLDIIGKLHQLNLKKNGFLDKFRTTTTQFIFKCAQEKVHLVSPLNEELLVFKDCRDGELSLYMYGFLHSMSNLIWHSLYTCIY